MVAVVSLLVVLTVSIVVTRVATIALTQTGLAREAARFQARSALTGVGYTTSESEKIVNHPVRRRILMLLMLTGNAGIVTVISSMILTFVNTARSDTWLLRLTILIIGLSLLWTAAQSHWLDRRLSRLIRSLLGKWTELDVRDYAGLLHVGGDYQVVEMRVEPSDWLAGKALGKLRLREEGIIVLGIQLPGGDYFGVPEGSTEIHPGDTLLLYGKSDALEELDRRRAGVGGELAHLDRVADHQRDVQAERDRRREPADGTKPGARRPV